MAHNPTRAANFYNTKRRKRLQPTKHDGVKHSDIMKRQGVGQTIPVELRNRTAHGFERTLFSGPDFIVRGEILAAGNLSPYGVNKEADRVYYVTKGTLFVNIDTVEGRQVYKFHPGEAFRAYRDISYSVASGSSPVECIVAESPNYDETFEVVEEGISKEFQETVLSQPTETITPRRRNQSKAKAAAIAQAAARGRHTGMHNQTAPLASGGASTPDNANSISSVGHNPKPMGPAAFLDD